MSQEITRTQEGKRPAKRPRYIDVTEDYEKIGFKEMGQVLPWEYPAWLMLQKALRVDGRWMLRVKR